MHLQPVSFLNPSTAHTYQGNNIVDSSQDKRQDRHVILAYMDESGEAHYGKTMHRRPHFLRSCVIVRENQLASVEAAVQKLCSKLPLCSKTGQRCRFHAKDMFWGTGDWTEYKGNYDVTIGHMVDMFPIIRDHKLGITFGHIEKPQIHKQYRNPIPPAVLTFIQCGHIVEDWLNTFATDQRWLPCVGTSQHDKAIREAFNTCR